MTAISRTMYINTWFVMYRDGTEDEQYTFLFTRNSDTSVSNPVVNVHGGVWLISFDLKTARFEGPLPSQVTQAELIANEVTNPMDQALYTTNPFQWVAFDPGGFTMPTTTPPVIQVQRVDNFKCNLLDCNAQRPDSNSETYHTRLITLHNGSIYWSDDPTVVNLPDDVGTGPPGSEEYP